MSEVKEENGGERHTVHVRTLGTSSFQLVTNFVSSLLVTGYVSIVVRGLFSQTSVEWYQTVDGLLEQFGRHAMLDLDEPERPRISKCD